MPCPYDRKFFLTTATKNMFGRKIDAKYHFLFEMKHS